MQPTAGSGTVTAGTTSVAGTTNTGGQMQMAFGGSGGMAGTKATGGSAGSSGGASGAAGAHTGGSSGTSSAGASGTAGTSAGTGGSTTTPGPCASPKDVSMGNSGSIGAGAACLRTMETFNTVGCSNFAGRTIMVNGAPAACGVKMAFPPAIDGYNYFDITAGSVDYASIFWYSS